MDASIATEPVLFASEPDQLASLAELPTTRKYSIYEDMLRRDDGDISVYHRVSCMPITKKAEDDLELLSDIYSWGERYLEHWENGIYHCSKCHKPLYSSSDKYHGPCVWPSFRKAIDCNAMIERRVYPYNNYTCTVNELYCAGCKLFVGHMFEDAKEKGDTHPEAHWRQ